MLYVYVVCYMYMYMYMLIVAYFYVYVSVCICIFARRKSTWSQKGTCATTSTQVLDVSIPRHGRLYSSTSPRHEHVVVILLAVSGPNDMPANCAKRCGLCGAKDHKVRTCGLPGAQKFRNAIRKTRPVHLKEKSRVLRGTGVAAMRKPGKKAMFLRMPLIRKR